MRVYAAGPVLEDGGTTFVCEGPANAGIEWTLTGPGTLTPTASSTDGSGVATATYSAAGVAQGASITVRADCYP